MGCQGLCFWGGAGILWKGRTSSGNWKRRIYPSGMLRAVSTTCQLCGLGALSKWQCQGGPRYEMEDRLDWDPTYLYWNLLKLELEIGVQILGKPNQNTTMPL